MAAQLWVLASLAAAVMCAASVGLTRVLVASASATVGWAGAGLVASGDVNLYAVGLVTAAAWSPAVALGALWAGGRGRVRDLPHSLLGLAALTVACTWARPLFYEPFADSDCHETCLRGPFTVVARYDLARGVQAAGTLAALAMVVVAGRRVFRGGRARPGFAVLAVLGALALDQAAALLPPVVPPERREPVAAGVHLAAAVVVVIVVGLAVLERVRLRARLADLRVALTTGAADGGVEALLARALGDPTVRVGHLVDEGLVVRADGSELGPEVDGRRRTTIATAEQVLAEVDHDETVAAEAFTSGTGPAVLAAVVNEGLRVDLRRRVTELEESRARLVARGDEERARLERDLHDGAQQGILALSIDLRRLHDAALTAGDAGLGARVERAAAATGVLLDRVRGVARGIHPATLDGGGLETALRHLADHSSPPVLLTVEVDVPLDPATERTAYVIVREACDAGADELEVRRDDAELVIVARRVGSPRPLVHDRVAVAEGSITVAGECWEVRLPCA